MIHAPQRNDTIIWESYTSIFQRQTVQRRRGTDYVRGYKGIDTTSSVPCCTDHIPHRSVRSINELRNNTIILDIMSREIYSKEIDTSTMH